jgi:radical SAM protein with 4Fe4S-binding SPASM domain
VWSKNYSDIYKAYYKYDKEEEISIGYTLEESKDWKYYTDYTDFLIKQVKLIERLRISIPFPGGTEDKENFYFINNKQLGRKIMLIAKHAIDLGIKPSIDCIVYPCMYETKEHFKFMLKFVENMKTFCGVNAPADIFPDGTVSYCYPLKETIKLDSNKYNTLYEILNDLILRYRAIQTNVKLPQECQSCSFFKTGQCNGPCLGFFDLSEETIGRNL